MTRPAASDAHAPVVMMVSFAEVLGGAERSLLTLAKHLPVRGWTPILVCPPGPLADEAVEAGLHVERMAVRQAGPVSRRRGRRKSYSLSATARRLLATAENAARLARLARRFDARLVHSNSLPSHLSAALAGRLAGRAALWHLREIIEPGPGRAFFSQVGRLTAGMVAISDAVAATVSHVSVDTVYNPVESPPAEPPPPAWNVPRPVVGYLGRLDPRKGIEDFIAAVADTGAHAVLAGKPLAGTPQYVASLHRLALERAPGRVHFVGQVRDPWQALAGMDVLVVPSLAEPFGRVAAEGQRAGVPVLAADAGGLPEIVTDGHDGLLFRPGDPVSLAECLSRALADESLRARLAAAGRTTSSRFDPENHADAMVRIFAKHSRTLAR